MHRDIKPGQLVHCISSFCCMNWCSADFVKHTAAVLYHRATVGMDKCRTPPKTHAHTFTFTDNIMMTDDMNPMLIDFSLAKFVDRKLTAAKTVTTDGQHTGDCGTATYMAPEVYAKKPYGIKAGRCSPSLHPIHYHAFSGRARFFLSKLTSLPTHASLAIFMTSNTCNQTRQKNCLEDVVADHALFPPRHSLCLSRLTPPATHPLSHLFTHSPTRPLIHSHSLIHLCLLRPARVSIFSSMPVFCLPQCLKVHSICVMLPRLVLCRCGVVGAIHGQELEGV